MTPEVFGEFLLLERLGSLSMSEAFLAVRLGDRSGKLLVAKRPPLGEPSSGQIAEALRREARVLGKRRIPGAVVLDAAGDLAGLPYVALEYVRGKTVEALLAEGSLGVDASLLIASQLATTLSELHEAGFVHGDLAPANVIIDDEGNTTLIDFGLAREISASREGPSGKPGYTSPQSALGRVAAPSDDIYAWGVLVSECLLGRRLFAEAELAQAALRDGELPHALEPYPAVTSALSLQPEQRPSADELSEQLARTSEEARSLLQARLSSDQEPPSTRLTREVVAAKAAVAARPSEPTMVALEPNRTGASSGPTEHDASPRTARRISPVVLLISLACALALGLWLGRRSAIATQRARDASITLPVLPARTKVQIDGRNVITPEAGRSLSIEPGKHTISIGGESETYDVEVQAGDHLVIIPLARQRAKGGRN